MKCQQTNLLNLKLNLLGLSDSGNPFLFDMKELGLYIHIPFCASKCPYCDFYSMHGDVCDFDDYTMCVIESLQEWSEKITRKADTLYFGGGTPSVIGAENIALITERARKLFGADGEITVECNPSLNEEGFFKTLAKSGVNRISVGVQSAVDNERKKLGRKADRETIIKKIHEARAAGIDNITLDVMLGVPNQSIDSLMKTIDFCIECEVPHISAYMLKLEDGTYFYNHSDKLNLPDDDAVADMYTVLGNVLAKKGYKNYEISNFAKPGFEGKHNLKYWNCEEYLGIGPSAHSFIDGKRFYYPRDISYFKNGKEPVFDCIGGSEEEYIMLRLRLADGIIFDEFKRRFNKDFDESYIEKAKKYIDNNFVVIDKKSMRLTRKGFLVSNTIISEIIM